MARLVGAPTMVQTSSPMDTNTRRTQPQSSADEIRILDLLPGSEDDDIKCDLRVVALGDSENYEALSYFWGKTVDGRDIKITHNLYAGFVRLRHPTQRRGLWVDQLCINQWDNEKAEQVKLIRLIYKSCSQSLIWLGEVNEAADGFLVHECDVAIDFIRMVAAANPDRPTEQVPVMLAHSDECERSRRAFGVMVTHGNVWWSRIWTVKETVLTPAATVVWGLLMIRWKFLDRAAENMYMGGCLSIMVLLTVDRYQGLIENFMYPVRGLDISRTGQGALNLLQRWQYRDATDPLYKVYGLMGLFSHNPLPSVQSCSYNLSPATL